MDMSHHSCREPFPRFLCVQTLQVFGRQFFQRQMPKFGENVPVNDPAVLCIGRQLDRRLVHLLEPMLQVLCQRLPWTSSEYTLLVVIL